MNDFWVSPPLEPYIVHESPSYLAVYKPPRMHTVPLRSGESGTLLGWIAARFPEVPRIKGRKLIEGGLVHRLDYETQGLVLCARTAEALEGFLTVQNAGGIVKEYDAVCHNRCRPACPGFPPFPARYAAWNTMPDGVAAIESAFRPFGKGRKAVRPLPAESDEGNSKQLYLTDILSRTEADAKTFFRLRIRKGFRHQIRCHLAWMGYPLLNDPVYGIKSENGTESDGLCMGGAGGTVSGFLALRAFAISFEEYGGIRRIELSERNVSE